ncbi:MAG: transporter [Parafilimonas terrae]|jgi:ZIP family zinc transporter|nr:transporter [Parafilimonas terrae]
MQAWTYTLIPAAAAVVGAAVAVNAKPGPLLVSAIQHFAAGVVFAAAAGEILPDLKHANSVWATLAGGGLGVAAMLGVRTMERRMKGPVGLLAVTGIDILVDGLVLGIAFVAGAKAGILLTVALTIEVLFLGLTVANELGQGGASKPRVIGATAGLVTLLPLGALLGGPVGTLSPPVQGAFLAFGLVALLYLVTEELLVEAHETEDRPWVTAMFFAGFLLLLSLDELVK